MAKKKTIDLAINRLEEISYQLENDEPEIEKMLKLVEEVDELLLFCNDYISNVEGKIKVIKEKSYGNFIEENFDNKEI